MSTTSSERRLHPMSLAFDVGRFLRHMILPAAIGLLAGGRVAREWFVFAIIGLSMVSAMIRYFTFRYTFEEKELVLRWGLFIKHERHIPYDRIQNIDALRSLAHRVFGMAKVYIQTGSGKAAEAELSVITQGALDELRSRVFGTLQVPRPASDTPAAPLIATATPANGTTLLHLPPGQLFLTGLLESKGLTVFAAILALASQVGDAGMKAGSRFPGFRSWVEHSASSLTAPSSPSSYIGAAIVGFILLLLVLRVGSAIWMMFHLFDFSVSKLGDDLRIEHGFLTHVVNTVPLRRIQWIVVDESLFHRLLGRVAVRITTAGGTKGEGEVASEREWLAPILRRSELAALLEAVQPGLSLDLPLRAAHRRGFWRAMTPPTVVATLLGLALAPLIGWWSLLIWGAIEMWALVRARLVMQNLGWASTETSIIFRGGALRRHTAAARFSRLQTVTVLESPFDRRTRMASVRVDTAGATGAHLEVRYLSRDDASELSALLRRRTIETAFVW
jgi:putative membrane protein